MCKFHWSPVIRYPFSSTFHIFNVNWFGVYLRVLLRLNLRYVIQVQSLAANFPSPYPLVCVFLSACAFRFFDASISTGMVAITLSPANTHAIISMIFSSWHSVNPPRMCPTPWRQRIMPHIEWMRTPDTTQRIVEMTRNIWCLSVRLIWELI